MNRRQFVRACLGCAMAGPVLGGLSCGAPGAPAAASPAASSPQTIAEGTTLPKPTPAQLRWQDAEIGLIYHFDLPIAAGASGPGNEVRKTLDPNLYNPAKLDTDQWLEAAKAAGAKYAIFTATHFNGFMQWQSDLYPYGLKQTRWRDGKGDVVADFVASCRKHKIEPGVYLSCHRNVYQHVWGYYVDWGKGRGTPAQESFNRIAEKMTGELCSRYGPLLELWYDAGVKTPAEGGPDVPPIVEKHQPDIVFYSSRQRADHRWIGNESGYAGDPCWATMPQAPGELSHNSAAWKKCLLNGDPEGKAWSPGMVDVPLRGAKVHSWFWAPNQDQGAQPADTLLKMYYNSVGRNCNFVIGEVITPEGLVPQSDIRRLEEFGREVRRRFGKPLAETGGAGRQLRLDLPRPTKIDHLVAMEDIAGGERVRAYCAEALAAGGTWSKVCEGKSIGHKRIHRFEPVEAAAVRLSVSESTAEPMIRSLAAFDASA
ncbi:MAG: alpha-L-fucosidase [Planctomycetota bacterium]|nr:alpha-L-fucosidase [Planctomycetota bacterium]